MSADKTVKVVQLRLRSRPVEDETINLPYSSVKKILEGGKREELWAFFTRVEEMPIYRETIHDKEWLKLIVNFIPTMENKNGESVPKYVPESEKACWYPLARRVHMLREIDGGLMTFSRAQAEMIWERFISPDFKLIPSQKFKEFMLDFAEAAGKDMPGLKEGQGFDTEVEYPDEKAPETTGSNGQGQDEPALKSA